MFRNLLLTVCTCVAFSATAAAQQVLTPERAIPDQYIVVFDEVQTPGTQVAAQAQALARQQRAGDKGEGRRDKGRSGPDRKVTK